MSDDKPAIEFECIVAKVQTLVDGGKRLTLDLPETTSAQAAQLMEAHRLNVPLRAVLEPIRDTNGTA